MALSEYGEDFDYYDEFEDGFEDIDYETHRGILAGLSFEEREQAIEQHMMQDDPELFERLVELLDDDCTAGAPMRGIRQLLATENPYDVRRFAGYLGVENRHQLEGDALVDAIIAELGVADAIQDIVAELSEHHIMALRELAERGGRWDIQDDDVQSLKGLPAHELGLSYVFHHSGCFTFVMPDEVVANLSLVDWEAALEQARTYRQIVSFFDKLVELRGIVPVREAVDEYRRCYPDSLATDAEIVPLVLQGAAEDVANYALLSNKAREMYALHYELMWVYEDREEIERSPLLIQPVTHGELGEFLEGLLKAQEGKQPRPLTQEMLDAASLLDWKMRQPPAWAFCQFLDERVPQIEDDFYFADKAVEDMLQIAQWGLFDRGAQPLLDVLDMNHFMPEADELQMVLDLWSDLCNGLPIWPNNGWSADELDQL